jgi:uracil-DNA glycosylase family 4
MSLPSGDLCKSCVLGGCGERFRNLPASGFLIPDGKMKSGVMICAESLDRKGIETSKALAGSAGFLFTRIMSRKKWERDFFRFTGAISCHPHQGYLRNKQGYYLPHIEEAIDFCPYLDREIDSAQPKVIVALGEVAFEKLTGERLKIMAARGYVFPERKGRAWVIPTFDPAFILKGNQHLALVLQMDLEKAVRIAEEGFEYDNPSCLEDPNIGLWEEFVDRGAFHIRAGRQLAVDIETPFKRDLDEDELEIGVFDQIDRISFAFEGDSGASVNWGMPYLPGIRRLIEEAIRSSKIVIWNRPFDRPRIEKALDLRIPIERTRDTMDAWHVLYNALPKKLGFATSCLPGGHRLRCWKHMNIIDPAYYSTMDAIALWRDDDDVMRLLSETGQMEIYKDICERLDPALEFMSLSGMLVDPVHKSGLRSQLITRMEAMTEKMTVAVPLEVRNIKVWKTQRAADKGLSLLKSKLEIPQENVLISLPGTGKVKVCSSCGEMNVKKPHVTRKTLKEKNGI